GGDGLTSPAATPTVTHDDLAPALAFQTPLAGAHVRGLVPVQVRASDAGSEVASLALTVDVQPLGAALAPAPPAPSVTATATWTTTSLSDGAHTLGAAASDQAGNLASASGAVIVDNTPPDTQITQGPAGAIQETTATFTFTGTDNLTLAEHLQFASRLDDGPWAPFGSATSATFTGLAQGAHVFQIKARDRAGNEDPTPAERSFTVGSLRVTIAEPANGATVSAGVLLVRGTVEADGAETGVTVNGFAAAIQSGRFAVLISVASDTTSLTAVATSAAGGTAMHTTSISVSGTPDLALLLRASPAGGTAPLVVGFSLQGAPDTATVELDFDGNGTTDFTGPGLAGQTFTYSQPGIYLPRVIVLDPQGNRTTASSVVEVLDMVTLDSRLQAKWTGLKDALRAVDVSRAVTLIHTETRPAYEAELRRFSSTTLANIDRYMTTIQVVEVGPGGAQYEMLRLRGDQTLSFAIWFQIDQDGIWRLRRF
ncbi:MAG: Ig-like domain-containing protein, partial [Anaerolineales bacterium]